MTSAAAAERTVRGAVTVGRALTTLAATLAATLAVEVPRSAGAQQQQQERQQLALTMETAAVRGSSGGGNGSTAARAGPGVAGRVDGRVETRALGPFRALVTATADWPAGGSVVHDRLAAAARLAYGTAGGRFGAWAGVDVSRARLVGALAGGPSALGGGVALPEPPLTTSDSGGGSAAPPPTDDDRPRTVGAAGLWWRRRSAVLSLSLTSGRERTAGHAARYASHVFVDSIFTDSAGWITRSRDSVVLVDPARPASAHGIGDAEARLAWGAGRFALDGALGARFLAGGATAVRASWGGVGASVTVAPYAALTVGGGVRPTPLASRLLRERYVSAGVRLTPARLFARPHGGGSPSPGDAPVTTNHAAAASAFDVRALGGGRYAVRVRVPGARVVELSGDFTGWQPVPLERVGTTDGWELVLPLAPGTHRVNIRVDGDAWIAPPGASTVDDDFNGTVGVVVVP